MMSEEGRGRRLGILLCVRMGWDGMGGVRQGVLCDTVHQETAESLSPDE
jgi:hypothetical protein